MNSLPSLFVADGNALSLLWCASLSNSLSILPRWYSLLYENIMATGKMVNLFYFHVLVFPIRDGWMDVETGQKNPINRMSRGLI
jgi:hypothetical protein